MMCPITFDLPKEFDSRTTINKDSIEIYSNVLDSNANTAFPYGKTIFHSLTSISQIDSSTISTYFESDDFRFQKLNYRISLPYKKTYKLKATIKRVNREIPKFIIEL